MFENCEPTLFAGGFQSPEGPSFDRDGVLHIVDWDAQAVYRITPAGEVSLLVNTGGMPNGSKFHRDGQLYLADCDLGILAVTPDGTVTEKASGWSEGRFRGPNDLVFAANGDLYFTDPRNSDREHPIGNIFVLRQDGQVELFAGGFQFPNGLVFSDDGCTLYLAETFPNRILAFELDAQGRERSRRVFAQLEGGVGPDGLAFGQDGNLYAAHYGKGVVAVLDPAGSLVAELPAGGARPTNVAFHDGALYVTEVEKGQVTRIELNVSGQPLYGLA